jgi:hypothetical protein
MMPTSARGSPTSVTVLKHAFGEDGDAWWVRGVPESVRVKAAERRERDPKRLEVEAYLDFIEYGKILEKKPSPFNEHFAARRVDKAQFVKALDKASDIRNRAFHATRHQHDPIRAEDIDFLREIQNTVVRLTQMHCCRTRLTRYQCTVTDPFAPAALSRKRVPGRADLSVAEL